MTLSGMYGGVDPAPALDETDVAKLSSILLDGTLRMFERMQALFSLRALATPEAIDAMARALLEDRSALLRHEVAFNFGQMRDPYTVKYLTECLAQDPHAMVRHEACEALGAIATPECVPLLAHYERHDPSEEVRESCEVALDNIRYLRDPCRLD
ncbi:MAG: HEAT repeat domain-containing protein [Methanobacteriota archaeon]